MSTKIEAVIPTVQIDEDTTVAVQCTEYLGGGNCLIAYDAETGEGFADVSVKINQRMADGFVAPSATQTYVRKFASENTDTIVNLLAADGAITRSGTIVRYGLNRTMMAELVNISPCVLAQIE